MHFTNLDSSDAYDVHIFHLDSKRLSTSIDYVIHSSHFDYLFEHNNWYKKAPGIYAPHKPMRIRREK